MEYNLCAPCLFGVEGVLAKELKRHKFQNIRSDNGRVFFDGGARDILRANLLLATAERVLIVVGGFTAQSFAQLFDNTAALPWEDYIPGGAAFPVKGSAVRSKIMSVPDAQSIIKKAVASRLGTGANAGAIAGQWLDESGPKYQIQFLILDDRATLFIDTSGEGLHKRGYRPGAAEAPLRETLAAALVYLSDFFSDNILTDPFCGTGTIPIEAALLAANIAPGLRRDFACERFEIIPPALSRELRAECKSHIKKAPAVITGSDIDPACVAAAQICAQRAGVGEAVRFYPADALEREYNTGSIVIANPPYGQRMGDISTIEGMYRGFGKNILNRDLSLSLISSHTEADRLLGRPCGKKRNLYNGMIKCVLYMYTKNRARVPSY